MDFAYWSINGEKRLHESETYGLLQARHSIYSQHEAKAKDAYLFQPAMYVGLGAWQDDNWAVRHPWKLKMLHTLMDV